jgi:DNA polymerase III subunit delta'
VIGNAAESGFQSLGQEVSRKVVRRAAARDALQRTLLIHGPAGSGKGAFLDDLLALLFCTAAESADRPCNACRGCRDARSRSHPDLVIGSPELWREERGTGESIVAAARRWLLDGAGSPVASDRRVIVIDGVDRANEQAQNVLLKALEEPGPRQMFILVADEPGRLLPTIRSRSQLLRIGPVPRGQLSAWLVRHVRLPADEADLLARISSGLSGRAIGYARNPGLRSWRKKTQAELLGLLSSGRAERFSAVRDLLSDAGRQTAAVPAEAAEDGEPAARSSTAEQRQAALLVVSAWMDLARDLLVTAAGRPEQAPAAGLIDGVATAAARIEPAALQRFIGLLERVHDGLRQNAAPKLAMEVAMIAWPSLSSAR